MRLNRSLLSWGIFLLLLGGVPLAVRQGIVPESTVQDAWRLWPLLLVAWGLGLILRRTPIEYLAGLLSAGLFGFILGSVLATGSLPVGCGNDRAVNAYPGPGGNLEPGASVDLRLNCGELTVRTQPGVAWNFQALADEAPAMDVGPTLLLIESERSGNLGFLGTRERWTLDLPTDPTLDVDLVLNAGTGDIDLTGAHLGLVETTINAGSVTMNLGAVAALRELQVTLNAVGDPQFVLPPLSFHGSIQANAAGNIRICAPTGAGLRLVSDGNIAASDNFAERGLVRRGDAWETAGFASAAVRIELETRANAGSFNLEPEGSCHG